MLKKILDLGLQKITQTSRVFCAILITVLTIQFAQIKLVQYTALLLLPVIAVFFIQLRTFFISRRNEAFSEPSWNASIISPFFDIIF